jgi:hypothetical protein
MFAIQKGVQSSNNTFKSEGWSEERGEGPWREETDRNTNNSGCRTEPG